MSFAQFNEEERNPFPRLLFHPNTISMPLRKYNFLSEQLFSMTGVENSTTFSGVQIPQSVSFSLPAKFHRPSWCTVPLQYIYKWLITQAMANWVTIDKVKYDRLIVEIIFCFCRW